MRRAVGWLGVLAVAGAFGCADVLGIEETTLASGSTAGIWSCVGDGNVPTGDGMIEIPIFIGDLATCTATSCDPVPGLEAQQCKSRLQQDCTGTVYTSDENGSVTVPVEAPFNGYLRIVDPTGERVEYLWYFSEPLTETRAEPFPIFSMTKALRSSLFFDVPQGGVEEVAGRGIVAVQVTDCDDVPAAGVTFEITTAASQDASTASFYFNGGFVSFPAVETDAQGLGGFVNVKAGTVGFRALPAELEGEPSAGDTLRVEGDRLTTVRLLPER
jgi:hypothetical protein